LPDIGSIALSFPLLGPWIHDPGSVDGEAPSRSAPQSGSRPAGRKTNGASVSDAIRDRKTAPALHSLFGTGGTKMKTKGTMNSPGEQATPALRWRV
jgi:hypothetical protein